MTKDEIKAEIAKLEAEFAQLVVNSHVIQGAKSAFNLVLSKIEEKEKAAVKEAIEEMKNDSAPTNGAANP